MKSKIENRKSKIVPLLVGALMGVAIFLCIHVPVSRVAADANTSARFPAFGYLTDAPTILIANGPATTGITPTAGMHRADIQWNFGTVTGSYSTCTVQAKTSFDGVNWLALGSAAAVTVTSNTLNAWSVIEQLGSTIVTTSATSPTAALSFGAQTEYALACSGGYGAAATVKINIIYK